MFLPFHRFVKILFARFPFFGLPSTLKSNRGGCFFPLDCQGWAATYFFLLLLSVSALLFNCTCCPLANGWASSWLEFLIFSQFGWSLCLAELSFSSMFLIFAKHWLVQLELGLKRLEIFWILLSRIGGKQKSFLLSSFSCYGCYFLDVVLFARTCLDLLALELKISCQM